MQKHAVELTDPRLFKMLRVNLILNLLFVSQFFVVVWKSVKNLHSRGQFASDWSLVIKSDGAVVTVRSADWYDLVKVKLTESGVEYRFRLWLRRLLFSENYIPWVDSKIRRITMIDSRNCDWLVLLLRIPMITTQRSQRQARKWKRSDSSLNFYKGDIVVAYQKKNNPFLFTTVLCSFLL